MGEAGLALDLVLGADVVPEVDRDDGRQPIDRDDQAQAVGPTSIWKETRAGPTPGMKKGPGGPLLGCYLG